MIGTLTIKARPLKLAYLVDPNNTTQVRETIRLSSSLWGGDYFPIIPLHRRMPETWREKPLKAPSAQKVILGYIEAFDPDILVQFSKEVPDYITRLGLEAEQPINPVLILTGNELLSHHGPPYCWDDATQKRLNHLRGLINLCDVTQQLYLGLPSWETEWHEKWEKRHQKRMAKGVQVQAG